MSRKVIIQSLYRELQNQQRRKYDAANLYSVEKNVLVSITVMPNKRSVFLFKYIKKKIGMVLFITHNFFQQNGLKIKKKTTYSLN